ncbi:MAG: hypothetical protein ACTHMM_12775 [Agriterribacter sp.]
MKNKIGKIGGFLLGALLGFLAIVALSRLHPEEDLAGITIGALLISGLIFAFIGSFIQSHLAKKH